MITAQQSVLVRYVHIMALVQMMYIRTSYPFDYVNTRDCTISNYPPIQPIKCTSNKTRPTESSQKNEHLLALCDIESTDCECNYIFSKTNENLFFIESSGRNHLRPRDACAIESAILQNAGMGISIIVGMISPVLDILANNATCQLYAKYHDKYLKFRHINVDTIFRGTPLNRFHMDGKLISTDTKLTTYQYR